MLQNRHPHINTRSVADFRTLDGIHKWLERASES
jgi:[acyl-carrier-protein] S-malonyltransferase